MATTITRTLNLVLQDSKAKTMSFKLANPKADLDKVAIDAAVTAIVNSNIFKTENGLYLVALKSSQIVTRQVDTIE